MFCPECGKQIDDASKACPGCGHSFETNAPVVQPVIPVIPEQPPARVSGTSSVKVFLITVFIGLAALAALMLFVTPGYLLNKDSGDSSSISGDAVSSSSADSSEPETTTTTAPPETTATTTTAETTDTVSETTTKKTTSETTATSKTTTTSSETTTATSETTTKPQTTTKKEQVTNVTKKTTKKDSGSDKDNTVKLFTDQELASFDDFDWCYGQDSLVAFPPEDAQMLTQPDDYTGSWKGFMVYDPTEQTEDQLRETLNVSITYDKTDSKIKVVLDPYYMQAGKTGGGLDQEYVEDDIVFKGSTTGSGGIMANNSYEDATLLINSIYEIDSQQYALGQIQFNDASGDMVYIYFALTRNKG